MIFELTSGLAAGLRGLVVKEMRTRSRGWRTVSFLNSICCGSRGGWATLSVCCSTGSTAAEA